MTIPEWKVKIAQNDEGWVLVHGYDLTRFTDPSLPVKGPYETKEKAEEARARMMEILRATPEVQIEREVD